MDGGGGEKICADAFGLEERGGKPGCRRKL